MKKALVLLLVALCSMSAFAAKTDSTLSKQTEYLVDGVYGYRKLVGKVDDPLSLHTNYIFECVTDTTEKGRHLFYELVIPAFFDYRWKQVVETTTSSSLYQYGSVLSDEKPMTFFLGYTKEQALHFFDQLEALKGDGKVEVSVFMNKSHTDRIYHYKGKNLAVPEGYDDKIYVRYLVKDVAERYFLLRSCYSMKAYISYKTTGDFKKALQNYTETTLKSKCVNNNLDDVVDFTGECHYQRLGVRATSFGFDLTDFIIFKADNPQFEDERFFATRQTLRGFETFPFGKDIEDANKIIDQMEKEVMYAYENKAGWYLGNKMVYTAKDKKSPGYYKVIGIVPFYIEGTHGVKSTHFEPYRMGCLGMTFNIKALEEIRKAINNSEKK